MLTRCTVSRRPARPGDLGYQRALFAESADELLLLPADVRLSVIEMKYRAHRHHLADDHPQATAEIIVADGTDAGLVVLDSSADEVELVDLVVSRTHRHHGVATAVLSDVLAQAAARTVTARVGTNDFASRRFFEQFGFTAVDDQAGTVTMTRPGARAS
jgi:N-acetylglutamate synthase-like GNAT family acetyltransferase